MAHETHFNCKIITEDILKNRGISPKKNKGNGSLSIYRRRVY